MQNRAPVQPEQEQVQREIDEYNKEIAVLNHRKKEAEAKLADIVRAKKKAAQIYLDRLNEAIQTIQAFQVNLAARKGADYFNRFAQEECERFLAKVQRLKIKQKTKDKPNYRRLAEGVGLVAELARSVLEVPTNFEKIDRQHRALEVYAHALEGNRPSRRKFGLAMRSIGGALIVLASLVAVAAVISLAFCPVFLPVTTLLLVGMGAGVAFLFGVHTRSAGKSEIEGAKPKRLPLRLLMFGDALKDKADLRGPSKISVLEGCRRRWFR